MVVYMYVCNSLTVSAYSALPVNAYGGFGRSQQGMMSPLSSGYSVYECIMHNIINVCLPPSFCYDVIVLL